jgi:hypothetical protein
MKARAMQTPLEPRPDPGATPRPGALEEHDLIALTEAVSDEGHLIPAGTIGTIVGVWAPEEAFEVEFTEPQAVLTLQRKQVRLHQRLAH